MVTWVQGFRGAVLVMTLAVYPLVYLPVAASLRSADPGQEEVSPQPRRRPDAHVRPQSRSARPAARILGGCLLVALVLLAEYGAFEMLGYQHVHHRDLHRVPRAVDRRAGGVRAVARAGRASACVVLAGEARLARPRPGSAQPGR